MSFRLCSVAPSTRSLWFVGRRRTAGTGIASSSRRYLAVSDRGSFSRSLERSREDDAAALFAGAEPHVDDGVGDPDHVGVVLDDEDRVALVAQLPQDRDQPLVVARVQADRRLVEHVQRVDQRRAERRREVDPLRFAARQRRRQPIEREVVEPDVAQEPEPLADLAQHLVGNRRVLLRQLRAPRRTCPRRAPSAPRRRRSCDRRPARRAPRAAAARRRIPGTSGSRDTG